MKKSTFTALLLTFALCEISVAQNCDCSEALSSDLKTFSTDFNSKKAKEYFYEYFSSSVTERKDLVKNSSNEFGLDVVIKKIPVGFQSKDNSSKSLNTLRQIEREVVNTGYFTDENLEVLITEYISTEQLEAYKACLKVCSQQYKNGVYIRTGGDLENSFYVQVHFINSVDKEKVTLQEDINYEGCEPINGLTLSKGTEIKNGKSVTQFFKRKNAEESAIISVEFTDGINVDPIHIEGNKTVKFIIPIGTIVASPLSPSEFIKLSGSTDITDYEENIWTPCDGRKVTGSTYYLQINHFVPDLRGQFIRGFNQMLSSDEAVTYSNGINPDEKDNSKVNGYSYQKDELKSHSHSIKYEEEKVAKHSKYQRTVWEVQDGDQTSTQKTGGSETRPKNLSVYYYIRIN
ncbi:hypothetical protein [Reichenbachiella sp. MALMAid0571]|uniref:hypothetical protein n=1 Tax=Reichenbachiella sp. MALMAid0571 TaxID=3143939 RepID=UPI0032DF7999